MNAQKRFSNIMSFLSIINAILVIFIHTYNIETYAEAANPFSFWFEEIISQWIARGAVPFFFMSSAFFLYSSKKGIAQTYKSRCKSLLIPYLLWNVIYMIFFAIFRHLSLSEFGMEEITVSDIMKGIFLYEYNHAYWYMFYLIGFTLLYPVLRWIIGKNKLTAGLVLVVLTVLYYVGFPKLEWFIYYYIGAVAGFFYRPQIEKVVLLPKKKVGWITLASLCAGTLLFFASNVYKINLIPLRNMTMILLLFFSLILLNVECKGILMGLSFMLYSMHPLVLESIEKIFYLVFPHTLLWLWLDYLLAPTLSIALIVIFCMLFKKVLPKLYSLLNGGRL